MEETIKEPIDLNPLALALLHPNPTVILTKGRHFFIKLHAINVIETVKDSGAEELTITFMHGESLVLSREESQEFIGKVAQIAEQIQAQIQAQQRQAMQQVGQQLSKIRIQ